MTPHRRKNLRMPARPAEPLQVHHPHAAGIDVHAAEHWVAVPPDHVATPAAADTDGPAHVRRFGACTADLEAIADWLTQCRITTVALESTGVYWIPLFELLERRRFQVQLVDPRQVKRAPGRPKTDFLDCQWLQRLHSYGLLSAAFRPADQVVVLRSYLRQRLMLIQYAGQHIQPMQKALEQMNIKLAEVVSDITGLTGLAIIKAILRGQRDPLQLAQLRNHNCKRTQAEIARALYGNWREEHLFALEQALALHEFYQQQLQACDARLQAYLGTFADKRGEQRLPPRPQPRQRKGNGPAFDVRNWLHRLAGVDLTVIEGIDASTALVILSEIGTDMSKFPTVKQFTSWLGLSPQVQKTAGKVKSSRVRRGQNRAAWALRLAALGCHHAKHALGAFFRRLRTRLGGPKAIVATARKIAERVYRLLKYGHEYVRQEAQAYETAYQARLLKGLACKARELGYSLVPREANAATPTTP